MPQAGTGRNLPDCRQIQRQARKLEEHLRTPDPGGQRSRFLRLCCYLGSSKDRMGEKGIQFHIESTIKTLKKVHNQALDAGVKLAVENHAGDMHSRELVDLIERAGPDFVDAHSRYRQRYLDSRRSGPSVS